MLVSERTGMADRPVGSLVPLDLVFELVEGNLTTERQKDVTDVVRQFKDDPADGGWAARVAKVICLLENVRDLPRTEHNIAALLVDEVGKPAPLQQVQAALSRLIEAKFVRNTDDGYKLQTAQEKTWETERRGYLDPKPSERNAIKRDILRDIFDDAKFKTYRYKDLRTFRIGIAVDGARVGEEGHLNINVVTADDASEYQSALDRVRDESRAPSHQNDLYWVIALTDEVLDLVKNLHASGEMLRKYEQTRSKNRITQFELACLEEEKTREGDFKKRLREKFLDGIAGGAGVFRGVVRDGSSLGRSASEALRAFLETVVGDLYPKL
ncbi:MAG: BREX system P-loop protein BrxC, partial [Anaerolineae bacterium]